MLRFARAALQSAVFTTVILLLVLPVGVIGQEAPASLPTVQAPAGEPVTINIWDPRQVMVRGGYLMWPILLCSIVSITFGLERLISLRTRRVLAPSLVRRLLRRLDAGDIDRTGAIELCRSHRSAMAAVLLSAMRHWGRPTIEIERAIQDASQREATRLRRNLRGLQGAANLATLLGLLGTIVGMIQAFNQVAVAKGLGRAELLANGIAQALLTTVGGLVVAIPSLFLYNYFAGKAERLVYELDYQAHDVVDRISSDATAAGPHGKTGKVVPKYVS
jgi:biopolymer transport protein ExbB